MSTLEARLYESDGLTLIRVLHQRRNLTVSEEFNAPGLGSLSIPATDADDIEHDQVVKVAYDGTVVSAFVVESISRQHATADGPKWVTLSGRGLMAWLEDAVVYPQGGVTYNYSPTDRPFNFAGISGHWDTLTTWARPLGVRQDSVDPGDYRHKSPKGWPDPAAKWIWATDPEATVAANARNWFRSVLTVHTARKFRFYATADNSFRLYLDGSLILSTSDLDGDGATWGRYASRVIQVPAGVHEMAAYVTNGASGSIGDRAGFLFSMCMLTTTGKPSTVVRRSDVNNWYVTATEPKWYASEIMSQLFDEGSARGTSRLDNLTITWTDTNDSSSRAWSTSMAMELRVGTNLLDVVNTLVDHGVDFWVNPATNELNAYETRGTDRSLTALLSLAKNVQAYETTATSVGKTAALVRSAGGWTSATDAAGVTARGRRETFLEFGNVRSESTAASGASRILARTAKVSVVTPSLSCVPTADTRPFIDFNVGDRVTTVSSTGGKTTGRLLGLALSESDDGLITYVPELEVLA